eukprot:10164642-Alexandrium_andersonii.AAC.1
MGQSRLFVLVVVVCASQFKARNGFSPRTTRAESRASRLPLPLAELRIDLLRAMTDVAGRAPPSLASLPSDPGPTGEPTGQGGQRTVDPPGCLLACCSPAGCSPGRRVRLDL